MNDSVSLREQIHGALASPGWIRALLWLVAPVLCVVLPGVGAILAFLWIALLMWLGRQPIAFLGLRGQASLARTIAVALLLAIGITTLSNLVLEPFAQRVAGHAVDLSRIDGLAGNWSRLGLLLSLSWLVGAVVEEIVFRGFLIGYGTRLFGERFVWPLAVLGSVIFGYSHLYQGLAGMLLTGAVGLILSSAYVLSRRNLALTMLAHGLIDTMGVVGIFLGFR